MFSIACKINLGPVKNNCNPGERGSLALEIQVGGGGGQLIQEIRVGGGSKNLAIHRGGGGGFFLE